MNSNSGGNYALKFVSGKYAGGQFFVRSGQSSTLGRSAELDVFLDEEMVSRKHAKITVSDGKVLLEDLGSTNGTFVNGEKVQAAILREGDRVLIGTSLLKLTRATQAQMVDNVQAKAQLAQAAIAQSSRVTKTGIMGKLEELPLPDLLQLFHSSKKTGVLVIHGVKEGRIYMRQGQVYYAKIEGSPNLSPRKSFGRIVMWNEGDFELLGADGAKFSNEIEEPIEGLLMESLRQHDELRRLEGILPPLSSALTIVKPLAPPLNALSKEQLDVFQLIHNHGVFQLVLDHFEGNDTRCSEAVSELIRNGYVLLS